ncbi:MAG TPA: cytochrome c [Bryobacteraceae bacterium]|nr:cytochrome c [Bryobacteraceae bacterium]
MTARIVRLTTLWIRMLLCVTALPVAAQQANEPGLTPSPATGKELYGTFCAVCHGQDARGNGSAAVALKTLPPDLTLLSSRNGGKFPLMKVTHAITGDEIIYAHGTRQMPIYGELFRGIRDEDTFVTLRVSLLTSYLASLQKK